MTRWLTAAFGNGRDWLRRLALGLSLLAVIALVPQAAVHASPAGHSIHQPAAVSASLCAQHHAAHAQRAGPTAGCATDDGGPSLIDCCQSCLAAAVLVEAMTFGPSVNGDTFIAPHAAPCERSPEGLLRPPCPAAA